MMTAMSRFLLSAVTLALLTLPVSAQTRKDSPPDNPSPPRSDQQDTAGNSSSRDTKVDTSPPPGDTLEHPGADLDSDVMEMHRYDPHRADKHVEVGDFYFKRQNYAAAESRYREALEWMPNHAVATYRLALTLEKMGKLGDARANYAAYLKILPRGPYAADARKALQRLQATASNGSTKPGVRNQRGGR